MRHARPLRCPGKARTSRDIREVVRRDVLHLRYRFCLGTAVALLLASPLRPTARTLPRPACRTFSQRAPASPSRQHTPVLPACALEEGPRSVSLTPLRRALRGGSSHRAFGQDLFGWFWPTRKTTSNPEADKRSLSSGLQSAGQVYNPLERLVKGHGLSSKVTKSSRLEGYLPHLKDGERIHLTFKER